MKKKKNESRKNMFFSSQNLYFPPSLKHQLSEALFTSCWMFCHLATKLSTPFFFIDRPEESFG